MTDQPKADDNPFGKPERCRLCPLFLEPGIVHGVGPDDARIFGIGEAPGAEEVDTPQFRSDHMKPFIGGAGRLLNALLAHAGIARKSLFISNAVKCRPPGNRTPTQLEIECCAPFLIDEIEKHPNALLLAFGETPFHVLTGQKGIGLYRGVPTEGFAGRKVFGTWHPAYIARAQYQWPFAVHDLARAKVESTFPEIRRLPFVLIREAHVDTHSRTLLEDARRGGACTFDFETTGLSPKRDSILLCGFAARADQAQVYDWTLGAQRLFQEVLDDPSIEIIGQNVLNFDLPFAEEKGFRIPWERVFDVMVAFHLANSSYGQTTVAEQDARTFRVRGAEKDLSFIASNLTDIPYWKSRENYQKDLRGVCGTDCIATHRAATDPVLGLKRELTLYDMTDLYWKHVLPVHPILKRMSARGVRIDEDRAARWAVLMEREADRLEEVLKKELGDPYLNLNSPQQLMRLLYEDLKLPVQYVQDKKKGFRPTANAEALEALAEMAPQNQILRSIVDIRHLRKMRSTYIEPAFQSGDGRIHPSFGVSKAATGRFNSWNPNAQNVPEEMRDIWIPDSDEHVLLVGDWSQIEWRIGIVLSADPVGLKLLSQGVDNHRAVAAEAFSKPLKEVTDYERHAAKFIVYGLGYGRGAASIAEGHNLPLPFVEEFIGRFFERFSGFTHWREANVRFVKENHFLANPFKRRRWWYTWQIPEVYNFPQQSTAADMMYQTLIGLDRELPKEATLRLTVHDEVVVNCPKDIIHEARDAMRAVMERSWPLIVDASRDSKVVKDFYPQGWFCPADIHIGTNWKQAKSKDPRDQAERAILEKSLGL